jgi:hypothetical protein
LMVTVLGGLAEFERELIRATRFHIRWCRVAPLRAAPPSCCAAARRPRRSTRAAPRLVRTTPSASLPYFSRQVTVSQACIAAPAGQPQGSWRRPAATTCAGPAPLDSSLF